MSELKVVKLRCEYKDKPLGLDVKSPRISWQIQAVGRGVMQTAYRIQVRCDGKDYDSALWDSGKVESDQSVHVPYQGPALKPRTRYYYRVKVWDNRGKESDWSGEAFWETGIMGPDGWKARWITPDIEMDPAKDEPCPMLRKSFKLRSGIKRARAYATSLGLYELYINGQRVGDWLLTPGWTSYRKRLQYQAYDVTPMLAEGENAIGAILGDGWYKGRLAWEKNRNIYGDRVALLVQLHVTYEDGSEDLVISDESWKSSQGPILLSEIYDGEIYDARLEKAGWNRVGFDDGDWAGVKTLEYPFDILVAQENVPVRRIQEIKPVEILKTPAGETVIDMGQNMVGWVKFAVTGKAGDEVVLKHAEVLDKDGNFYTANIRTAKQTIHYILKGGGKEVFEPHFTFQGFRYVKVEKYPGKLSLDNFTGVVIHSDMEPTGDFECSNELINKLQHNILWGQKGNFVDVPTDCPQRDERLGWTGDAQVFIRTACFNMNVAPFFTKWLRDLEADQLPNGAVPHVVPNVLGKDAAGSAAWADAAAICPWTIYICYGDRGLLEERYESMKAWVEYIRKQGDNEYLWNTGFHFGDWLGLDAHEGSYVGATARDFIATAFYAYSTSILVKTARVLGKKDEEKEYSELYHKILENFRREFVTPNGRLAVSTQTAHVLALMFDLVEEKDKERTVEELVKLLKERKYHLTTGFVGTPYLCHVLTRYGKNDVAYKLVTQTDFPSWLYQVTKGATTVWEHWDGIKEDGTFWSADMNSFNHYAYGSIGDWLYRTVTGIDVDEEKPGYKHIYIRPKPGQELDFARARLESMYGQIRSGWTRSRDGMEIEITVPANTTATVVLPGARAGSLIENGESIGSAQGILNWEETEDGVRLELGSGDYCFKYKVE